MSIPRGMSGVQAPPRPTTASRQGPGGMMPGAGGGMAPIAPIGGALRPPTGMNPLGGAPLGAAGMMGGFRPVTGMAGGDAMRPTTTASGGMGGGPTRAGGGGVGRQVMDKSYFVNELRHKNKEIMLEVEKISKEIHEKQMGNQQFDQIERKYASLQREVKEKQGELADQNIILDTVGTGGPLDDLRHKTKMLQDRNAQERLQVDAVFGERIQVESAVKELETQVAHHQEEMMSKLNELPIVKQREYKTLAEENTRLHDEVGRLEAELEAAAQELSHLEYELSRDQIKQRALALQEKLSQLTARRYELEEEDKKLQLSPEEQRAQLKEQIRRDNADIQRAESQIQELQQAIRRGESKLHGVRMDLSEQQGGLDAADKYDKLLQQERELTDFIENFEPKRAEALNDCAAKQANVVQILERVSRHLSIKGNMPNQRRFKEMQDELEYKKVQVQNAAMTSDRLQEERAMRQQELEKISTLEAGTGRFPNIRPIAFNTRLVSGFSLTTPLGLRQYRKSDQRKSTPKRFCALFEMRNKTHAEFRTSFTVPSINTYST